MKMNGRLPNITSIRLLAEDFRILAEVKRLTGLKTTTAVNRFTLYRSRNLGYPKHHNLPIITTYQTGNHSSRIEPITGIEPASACVRSRCIP